ncbi:MAG: hypothetical protein JSW38_12690 [Dehalococcoidia bacterium]|nr:MAG: hypothetical protein JSW38_12690 [Dehalococcoidia bacterium]
MSSKSDKVQDDDSNECVHHWFIDERNYGICKKCGADKQFSRSWSPLANQKAWSSKNNKAQQNVLGTKS